LQCEVCITLAAIQKLQIVRVSLLGQEGVIILTVSCRFNALIERLLW